MPNQVFSAASAVPASASGYAEYDAVLPEAVAAVRGAGATLLARFRTDARPGSLDDIVASLQANDAAVLEELRPRLTAVRPQAGWVEDELEGGSLPPGEWWVSDPAEGNINHVHGMDEWAMSATLVRDNAPVLTVVHIPLTGDVYTAAAGSGARLNGSVLHVSAKTEMKAALVGTGQARPGESPPAHRRIGASVTAMLEAALVVRVSVPATIQLLHVAAGRMDAFWQFSDVRSGLLAGALLVAEAGGAVTDLRGEPWSLTAGDFLAAAPALHAQAVAVLSAVR